MWKKRKDETQKDTRQGLYKNDNMQRRQQNEMKGKIRKDCRKP